ncbi:MAG: hypothetical protein LBV22_03530 [Mycoplasmataceae bacterium]|jgi:hypothetical protein|nr:hypothetical protein [Mycoplasmataceae bacterium]
MILTIFKLSGLALASLVLVPTVILTSTSCNKQTETVEEVVLVDEIQLTCNEPSGFIVPSHTSATADVKIGHFGRLFANAESTVIVTDDETAEIFHSKSITTIAVNGFIAKNGIDIDYFVSIYEGMESGDYTLNGFYLYDYIRGVTTKYHPLVVKLTVL